MTSMIMIGVIVWLNLYYVQPYGMLGEGHEYCKALTQEGYFEGRYDTADHRNCTIGYEDGRNNNKKYWTCPYRENCFSYDDYNDSCELELDMKDFGMRCTWGSIGYFATALTILLWGIVAFILIILLTILFNRGYEK